MEGGRCQIAVKNISRLFRNPPASKSRHFATVSLLEMKKRSRNLTRTHRANDSLSRDVFLAIRLDLHPNQNRSEPVSPHSEQDNSISGRPRNDVFEG